MVELDLDDADDETGVGELLIRGQNIVAGYWNKPEQTAETFVDGWLHTGDLARIDDDGFVQIVDRKKDMVNRGGENVYCVEVENALAAASRRVRGGGARCSRRHDGGKGGSRGRRPGPGASPTPPRSAEFAATLLADFKIPQYMSLREEPLPRNAGGKVLKPTLRETTDWGKALR